MVIAEDVFSANLPVLRATEDGSFDMSNAVSQAVGQQRAIGTWIIITILTFGVAAIVWTYKTHLELFNYRGQGIGGMLGAVIYIFAGFLTFFLVPNEVIKLYEEDGRAAPFTWKIGLWFLLPLIGGFIWFNSVQGALNEFWGSKGAAAP
ncbi:MAG: hypothetical protein DK306_000496 [Chloroflexi bacterium]|jgi:hypothetical protein|nr:MAG: hypothetical protein DK306_000496 [Chloroflexota bacterium]